MSNQTVTYLKRRFEEVGFRINPRHGQNFLIDLNLLRLIIDTARLDANDVVLEVGTGMGSLTALMAPRVAAVVSVEIDPRLHQLAMEELADFDNVFLLKQDALKNKNTLDRRVLETIATQLAARPGARFKLVANLPYSVATPVISNLLAGTPTPQSMTVTIQKELAERMAASPGTKDYSALSIWVQAQADAEIMRVMPPTVFWPRPKVHSAIVHVALDEQRRQQIGDLAYFHGFIRDLFCHRRKYLRSVLVSITKDQLDKADIDRVLAELQLGETCRAEELDVPMLLRLCERVRVAADA